jgi:hypothetical protein
MWRTIALTLVVVSGACAREGNRAADDSEAPPEVVFETLEGRLLKARNVGIEFQISSSGILEVDLQGTFSMSEDGTIDLAARGDFGSQPVDLVLSTDGDTYRFGSVPDLAEAPVPGHLREALVIGFMRMGLLHNLARLTGNAPPDHAEGGAGEWVGVGPFLPDTVPGSSTLSFRISVAGEPAGTASLEVSPDGYPTIRHQTVQFDAGEMRVLERYESVVIDP